MPRIPDVTSLGARPVPVNRGSVVGQPRAGAVGDAISGLGQTTGRIGQQMFEKQDRLAYAAAKTAILKADVQARTELQNDNDYGTFEARYTEKMKAARDQARKLIGTSSDRAMFDSDADLDFERGRSQVLEMANTKRVSARLATFSDGLDALGDAGRDAPDEGTRSAIIGNANEMFDAAFNEGIISADKAASGKREWASNYIAQQVTGKLLAEDYDGAKSIFDKNVDKLDWRTAQDLQSNLKRMGDSRQAAQDAYGSAPGYVSADTPVTQPSVGKMIQAIESNESGGRQFGADGKPLTSSAGAVGVMQVMPGTGPEAAALAGLPWDAEKFRTDKDYNRALGVAYFNKQLQTFGDPVVAAAAYNAGPGAVQKALKNGGNWLQALPQETQDYVANFQKKTGAMQSARTWDKESWYKNIDERAAKEGWSFERTERAKDYADRQIARDEGLLARQQQEADEAASETVLALGDNFTDVGQIPPGVWGRMSVASRARYEAAAEARRKDKKAKAESDTVTRLKLLRINDPAKFAKTNLGEYAHMMTPSELVSLREDQVKLVNGDPSAEYGAMAAETIGRYDVPDMWSSDKNEAGRQRVRVIKSIETELRAITQGKRKPTEQERYQAFVNATGEITTTYKKTFLGMETGGKFTETKRRYEMTIADIPESVKKRIADGLVSRFRKEPTEDQIVEEYIIYKGRYW